VPTLTGLVVGNLGDVANAVAITPNQPLNWEIGDVQIILW